MKVVAIIQARMGSSRLPGKVLLDLVGQPVLARVVQRVLRADRVDQVVVATSTAAADNPIPAFCQHRGWSCFRGSEDDVLQRFHQAAITHQAETVLRITADCPLIDPDIIDKVVLGYQSLHPNIDHVSNINPVRTFPRGLDIEAFGFELLDRLEREEQNPVWREHVTERVFQIPSQFRIHCIKTEQDFSHLRWTLDTEEDMEFALRVYRHFGHDQFTWKDVIALLRQHPEWIRINQHVVQKKVI